MAKKQITIMDNQKIISWEVLEYEKYERSKIWYVVASLVAALLLLYSILTSNFLFAIIIVASVIIIILHDGQEPTLIKIDLTDEGVIVGKKFYDYDEIKNFSIIYKPRQDVKNLYFEFQNSFKHRLSIPLNNIDPLRVRDTLLQYIEEDLERTNQPLSEGLAQLFKL
ncbi:MAG: hypothetical protein ABII94_00410 [Patescibacteria group bacterium]